MNNVKTCHRCGSEGHLRADCPDRLAAELEQPADGCRICGSTRHWAIACPLHPTRLRHLRGDACGPGACTGACRSGDHYDCAFGWCDCRCHTLAVY